jgi:SH3-like domain-containing protein
MPKAMRTLLFFFIIIISINTSAKEILGSQTGLPLPRFASLKSDETNVRTGPGLRYPIKWVLVRKNMPVEIVAEYDQWRKIKDIQGDDGWVHMAVLSGKRTAIVQINNSSITKEKSENSRKEAILENGVLINVKKCLKELCQVEVMEIEGYTQKLNLWGVYPNEVFE